MCEILIRWQDKVPQADPLYAFNFRKGDVLAVCSDGWQWSPAEQTNTQWRIIKLPNITESLIQYLLDVDFDVITGAFKNKRKNFMDAIKIPQNVINQINNNQVLTSQIDGSTLLSWITVRM